MTPLTPATAPRVPVLVIDAGGFIAGPRLERLGEEFYTISEVLNEVKDKKARDFIQAFPFPIKTRIPDREDVEAVVRFAKETGDFRALSMTDIKVLALTLGLDREAHGGSTDHLKMAVDQPLASLEKPKMNFFDPVHDKPVVAGQTADPAQDASASESDEEEEEGEGEGEQEAQNEMPGFGDFGDDQEGGWITPHNVSEYNEAYKALSGTVAVDKEVKVGCLTTDFAMQNVILQMKLNLITVDGMVIKKTKRWILRCYSCYKLCHQADKLFCPNCGHSTLQKVAYEIDENGVATYHLPAPKRGQKKKNFKLPAPRGGRNANNIILYENQLPKPQHRRKQLSPEEEFFSSNRKMEHKTFVGFAKNPNQQKKRTGKKKNNRK
uniref:RNA-binding protein NOB1 n=1 Tax=Arcella intermedia TaxID=1963864 RepID=A0A6B2L7F7_9EUKA